METQPLAPAAPAAHSEIDDLGGRPNVEITQDAAPGVRVAQALGWLSVGLGLTQIIAPRLVERMIGVNRGSGLLMRLVGLRELANGLGLLGNRRAAAWTGARSLGDAIDLGLLAAAALVPGNDRGKLAKTALVVLGAGALDVWVTDQLDGDDARQAQVARVTHVGKSVTIDASPHELYDYWRELSNLPRFLEHLRSVTAIDATRSRWVADGPQNTSVRWEAEIVEDKPGRLIAWQSTTGPFESRGSVRFLTAPGGRGTEVVVDMHYDLMGGMAGKLVALVSGRAPGLEIGLGLHRLKQIFEIGEPMRSDASIHPGLHCAQPPTYVERDDLLPDNRLSGGK